MLVAEIKQEKTNTIPEQDAQLLVRALKNTFAEYVKASNVIPIDIVATVSQIEDPEVYVDIVSSTLPVKIPEKIEILQELDFTIRVTKITKIYNNEIKLAQLENTQYSLQQMTHL
jgi:ATP-dependent Lon protease